ncbi:hypothetical protein [Gimesia chilikensis]|uniref:Uncharacterized protein n=1 Tax=Gimesia chilikensis TaxID=2605989 RepID=A0A517PWC4_9PLAN|nr:hypothetical protein [Gimesia chilikensis]QDT23670.1 hypothetical protein HG66A1_54920 [Gimesia chilikensis]
MVKRNPSCDGCEKCGEKLDGMVQCCCTHTCHAICVTLEGGCEDGGYADCSCEEPAFTYLEYNQTTKSYKGEIGCGELLIDLEFVIKYCKDSETCVICLISNCLTSSYNESFDGECDNLVSCKPIPASTESCIGSIDQDGVLVGGIEHEWEVDVSGCGDTNCTSFVIKTVCTDRIFPEEITETAYEGGCIGCECLCQDLCITYRGHNTCEDGGKIAIDGDTWEFEVTRCSEADPDQQGRTISIVLQKNVYTEECELLVTTPYVDSMGVETTKETIVELNECPDIPYTKIWVDETEGDYFEFECWKCGLCPDELICICECDPDSPDGRGYVVPEILTLDWAGDDGQNSDSGSLSLIRHRELCYWEGRVIIHCFSNEGEPLRGIYTFIFQPGEDSGLGWCGWSIQVGFVVIDAYNNHIPFPPASCTNPILDAITSWSEGGGSWSTTCDCDPFDATYAAQPNEVTTIAMEVTE